MDFYQQCAVILEKLQQKKGSIKSLCLHPKIKDKKKTYALVCESLKHRSLLRKVITQTDLLALESQLSLSHAIVLLQDFFFTKRGIQCGGWQKFTIVRHKDILRTAFSTAQADIVSIDQRLNETANEQQLTKNTLSTSPLVLPRYIRVSGMTRSSHNARESIITQFMNEGWQDGGVLNDWKSIKYVTKKFYGLNTELLTQEFRQRTVYRDQHLADLLVFPPNTDMHAHALLQSGHIVLQDKASCFPATLLAPPYNTHVIDACAAPGNKTSHLSAIMNNTGKITAFDLSANRLATLKKLTRRVGCSNIEPICGSFLDVNPTESRWHDVEYILLDPSCSGSGIVNRLDQLVDAAFSDNEDSNNNLDGKQIRPGHIKKSEEERLHDLAAFQTKMLLHAMTFPHVKRISYSTCSIHSIENEQVVATVLQNQGDTFRLAPYSKMLPEWPSRGMKEQGLDHEQTKSLVRASASDGTNGFFVAVFERIAETTLPSTTTISKKVADCNFKAAVKPQTIISKAKKTNRGQRKKRIAVNA